MTTQVIDTADVDAETAAFGDLILESANGFMRVATIHLGTELGLYRALRDNGPLTPDGLAAQARIHPRYAREWLEQQVLAKILRVRNPEADAADRVYALPAGHARALADIDHPDHIAPLAQILLGAVAPFDKLVEAYRTGGGVPYADYGRHFREGQGGVNRNALLQDLPNAWIPAMPDVHERLAQGKDVRVADFGCGAAFSAIGIAKAFRNVRVDGFDLDPASVELARRNVKAAGLEHRVLIHERDAADADLDGQYDLVGSYETLHDIARPVDALKTMKRLAKPDGTVLVVDERTGDNFTAEGEGAEELLYGWSVMHCLPSQRAHAPSASIGTLLRPGQVRDLAAQAGYAGVEDVPIENLFLRAYRLRP